jgi:AmmeMemoRadiSam system protein B/AmmeMemoRadiSam system protein A
MKAIVTRLPLFCLILASCTSTGVGEQNVQNVRPASVAGQFYPADAAGLRLAIQNFLGDARPATVEKPVAIVVPHAGYLYSGQIAADGYTQVKGREYDLVVILGTNHTSADLRGISIYPRGAYRTPLGDAAIDQAVAAALLAKDPACKADTGEQEKEHSVEVQVPFIQVLFPKAAIVPVVVGTMDPAVCARFGKALAEVLRGRRALIIASSDLSHYPAYDDAVAVDRQTLEAIAGLDPDNFRVTVNSWMTRFIRNLGTCACGEGPILAAMAAAKALGATHGVVVSYANSGDVVASDRTQVVGYGSVVFSAAEGKTDIEALVRNAAPPPSGPLTASDKKALLQFARLSLQRYLSSGTLPLSRNLSARLQFRQGVFVTLKQNGELRGCIGHMPADFPLAVATGYMAVQAGINDPRFSPISLKDLAGLEIEISALSPLKSIEKPSEIVLGRDGVVIQKGGRSAVFLPQVATEQEWDLTEMLDNLCLKAGLPSDGWKSGARFQVFQADVFGENQSRNDR